MSWVLNAAAQVQAVLLVLAAVTVGLAALAAVLRLLLGAGWWRVRRLAPATDRKRVENNDEERR